MAAKDLKFSDDARARLKEGIDVLANTLKSTLGPRGRNVIVDKKFGPPQVNSDGVTTAKEIDLDDPFANMGAQLLKEVSKKTNDDAGDGTTTSTVLAQAIISEGFKNVAAGADPMALKRGMDIAMDTVRKSIAGQSTTVSTKEQIENVAKRQIKDVKDHICYGVETESQLMYARGRLSALETLLQDIKNLHKEDNDGTTD